MIQMNEELKLKYQNKINYCNADLMFLSLDNLIKSYGREYILETEFVSEENCVNNYVIKSNVIRLATDSIEHYIKAILISNGSNWDEAKSWGHNLLDLFNHLDEDSQNIIITAIMPINKIDYDKLNKKYNNNYKDFKMEALIYLQNLIDKYEHSELEINNINYNSLEDKYKNYKNQNIIVKRPSIQGENIVHLNGNQSFDDELVKLASKEHKQLINIRARFPGQYIVNENVEFVVSMVYALNSLSKYYRQKEEQNIKNI